MLLVGGMWLRALGGRRPCPCPPGEWRGSGRRWAMLYAGVGTSRRLIAERANPNPFEDDVRVAAL